MTMNDTPKRRSYLFEIGWVRQKGEWLNELRSFAGRDGERIDLEGMERAIRAQIDSGTAYVDAYNHKVDKASAAFIRLDTGIIVSKEKTGDVSRYLVIKFHRNRYDMWAGLDFEYGDEAKDNPEEDTAQKKEPFYDDIFWRPGWQDDLLNMAVQEPWDNEFGPAGRLLPYLKYTYRRLTQENKVYKADGGKLLAFNTGLVTRAELYPIVAICDKNEKSRPEWKFDRFVAWPEDVKGEVDIKDRLLIRRVSAIPEKADWSSILEEGILRPSSIAKAWKSAIANDVFFHKYNPSKLPSKLLEALAVRFNNNEAKSKAWSLVRMEEANLQSEKEMRDKVAEMIWNSLGNSEDVKMMAVEIVQEAFEVTLRRLDWEIGTAVPMWEPEASINPDTFSFMLPLSFGEDPLRADVALVLRSPKKKDGETGYVPKSLLTLKAAYSNARLLRRPEALWLRDYIEKR